MWVHRLRSWNGGGGDRPRPFISMEIWAGFVLAENRGGSVTRVKTAVALVSCIHVGVSELLAQDEWRGLLSLQERNSLRLGNGVELQKQGQSRYGLAYHKRLPSAR